MCTGEEDSLLECLNVNDIGNNDCDHSEDAGVICEGTYHIHFPTYIKMDIMCELC